MLSVALLLCSFFFSSSAFIDCKNIIWVEEDNAMRTFAAVASEIYIGSRNPPCVLARALLPPLRVAASRKFDNQYADM